MSRPKKMSNPYKGDLIKPIIVPAPPKPLGFLTDDDPQKKSEYDKKLKKHSVDTAMYILHRHLQKLLLLEEHYKIKEKYECADDPTLKFMFLCLELAKDHIEGFRTQEEKSSGRKKKWDAISHAFLYWDVTKKIEEKQNPSKFGVSWACKELIKQPYWSSFLSPKMSGENRSKILENEFSKAKNSVLIKLLHINKDTISPTYVSEFMSFLDAEVRQLKKPS